MENSIRTSSLHTLKWLWVLVVQFACAVRQYDVGLSSFSPDGALHQLEYAQEASNRGALTIGIQTDEAVLLVCAKNPDEPLRRMRGGDHGKFFRISSSQGCAAAGFVPDTSMMVAHGREKAMNHWFTFGESPSVQSTASEIAELALSFSSHHRMQSDAAPIRMSRPCGAALLVAGVDLTGPALYHVDPLGSVRRWRAKAIGKHWEATETKLKDGLEKLQCGTSQFPSIKDALRLAINILGKVSGSSPHEEAVFFGPEEVEVAIAFRPEKEDGTRFKILFCDEVKALLE